MEQINNTQKTKSKSPILVFVFEAICWLILVGFDQYTKFLSVNLFKDMPARPVIPGVLEFLYLENRGAAFSLFQDAKVFFFIVAAAAIIFILIFLIKLPAIKRFLPLRIVLVCISAGAMGNLIDRVLLSYVRDFIYFSLIDFPVFNVADIYVTVSVAILIVLIMFYYKDSDFAWLERKKKETDDTK